MYKYQSDVSDLWNYLISDLFMYKVDGSLKVNVLHIYRLRGNYRLSGGQRKIE